MNNRFPTLFLVTMTATGSFGCSADVPSDDERSFPLETDEGCVDPSPLQTPSITTVAGPLRSSAPRSIVSEGDGVWFTDAQNLSVSHLGSDGTLERFKAPFPSETVFDAAVGPDETVWFDIMTADRVKRIGRMTRDGTTTLFEIPSGEAARRLAAGPGGAVWFTAGTSVGRIEADGTIAQVSVGATTGDITGGLGDSVWFTEPEANRVGRLTMDGSITHFELMTPDAGLGAIALGPDGNVWFTQTNTGKIGWISDAGVLRELDVATAPSKLGELTAGPDGRLWFTLSGGDFQTTRVGALSPCGTVELVDLPKVSNPIDFQPAVDVPALPFGIAGGDDEVWITARLDPFETGVVLRLDLADAVH